MDLLIGMKAVELPWDWSLLLTPVISVAISGVGLPDTLLKLIRFSIELVLGFVS